MICNVQTFHIVISGLNENGNDVDIVPKLDAHNARYKYTCVCERGDIVIPWCNARPRYNANFKACR